ncbi:MAG: HAMP domain-containing sensor histidine kinase [Treponema sp.]|nr:HAMP domain-containing sensor histidine kinase [Treponema sp.]
MKSIRLRLTLQAVLLFAGGLLTLLLANLFLLEPWYVAGLKGDFERLRAAMVAEARDHPDMATLVSRMKSLAAGTGFRIVVVDREGQVVASSVPEFQAGQRFPLPREELGFFLSHERLIAQGESFFGILEAPPPGQSQIRIMSPLAGALSLEISQPLERLRTGQAMTSRFSLLVGLLVLAFEFALAPFMAGSLLRPILDLSEIAQRVAAADFGARYRHKRRDELGRLGDSLNEMADTLARNIDELRAANAGLAGKIKAQEDFLAGASHELKTPVGLMRGYAEAIKLGIWTTDAERQELADIIMTEADHLDRLVRDLSFIAMAKGAGPSLLPVEADLRELAARALERHVMAAKASGVELRLEGNQPAIARFDPDRILQALDNLLSNALRHAGNKGYVILRVSSVDGLARIEVENSGDPIPEGQLERLFEPFYRIDTARSRRDGGSGLGLALVRAVAEAHGGDCGIANSPVGVRAWIDLPLLPSLGV